MKSTAYEAEQTLEQTERRSKEHLTAGLGLGLLSLGALAVGATCPMCVVAVPALIGSGTWNSLKARRMRERTESPGEHVGEEGHERANPRDGA